MLWASGSRCNCGQRSSDVCCLSSPPHSAGGPGEVPGDPPAIQVGPGSEASGLGTKRGVIAFHRVTHPWFLLLGRQTSPGNTDFC